MVLQANIAAKASMENIAIMPLALSLFTAVRVFVDAAPSNVASRPTDLLGQTVQVQRTEQWRGVTRYCCHSFDQKKGNPYRFQPSEPAYPACRGIRRPTVCIYYVK